MIFWSLIFLFLIYWILIFCFLIFSLRYFDSDIIILKFLSRNPTPSNNRQPWQQYGANKYYIEDLSIGSSNNKEILFNHISFWTQLLPKISHIEVQPPNNNAIELQRSLGEFSYRIDELYGITITVFMVSREGNSSLFKANRYLMSMISIEYLRYQ